VTFAPDAATRESRNGIEIVPDQVRSTWPAATRLPALDRRPAAALDGALDAIRERYGAPTAEFVAMQLEYPTERGRVVRHGAHEHGRPMAVPRSLQ
jgi:hypothetical protein